MEQIRSGSQCKHSCLAEMSMERLSEFMRALLAAFQGLLGERTVCTFEEPLRPSHQWRRNRLKNDYDIHLGSRKSSGNMQVQRPVRL